MIKFLSVVILFFMATLPVAAMGKPSVSVEAFGQLPSFGQVELSPDGKRVASLQNFKGTIFLVTQSFDETDSQKPVFIVFDNADIDWFHWVSNRRLVISVGVDKNDRGTRYHITRMMAMNWDRSEPKQLMTHNLRSQFHDNVVSMLPDDPDHILVAVDKSVVNHPDVFKVNVHTGKMKRHVKSRAKVRTWMADGNGVVRLGLGIYKNRNRLIFRNGKDEPWRTLARYDVIKDEVPFSPEGFSEVPHIIYVSKLDESGRKSFYRYDTEKGQFLDKVAWHDNVDVSSLIINKKGEITGYSYLNEYWVTVYKSKFYQSLQRMLKKNFPDHMVTILTTSRDERKFILKVSGPDLPGELYILNLVTKDLYKFADTNPLVDITKLSDMEIVHYKARDGLRIPAYISFPKGVNVKNAKKLPMVIMPHGGPFARDGYGFDYWVQFLTTRGYAVLQMNYRGSTGYGTKFERMGYHEWGRKMLEDINDGTKWAIEQGYADPKRICIMGGSYGGYAALQAVVKDQSLYKCSIAFAPVTDVRRMLLDDRDFLDYRRNEFYVRNDDLSTSEISPVNHIGGFNLPVLLLHGTIDRVVPYKQGKKFADKMKKRRKDFKFITLKEGDHHLSNEKNRIKFFREVEKFLKKHL
ncbi:MAG: S9 family peptidase [Alphaproteobacteria bacterium]|nr:S9 family peptidase [Alphaproteobacteria bacterium]